MPTGEIEVVIEDILDVAAPKRRFEVSPRVLVCAMLFTVPKNVCLNFFPFKIRWVTTISGRRPLRK